MAPSFRAGGLASGLDTNSIIDQLVKIESRPLDILKQRQSALKTQVSLLGNIASKLAALSTTAKDLAKSGTTAVEATSKNTAFSTTADANAVAGRYSIGVTSLASAAKARSSAFVSGTDAVRAGTLSLSVMGTNYDVAINLGDTLSQVATTINRSGAPVTATTLSDGTSTYLSITNNDTGFRIGEPASSALSISETYTGGTGQELNLAITNPASNARLTVDGLSVERTSNNISDVISGVTLSLKATTTTAEDLVLATDTEGTAANVQKFIDSYNEVISLVQKQLAVTDTTNRATTLAGDGAIRGLQKGLQSLVTSQISGSGTVQTLADIGVKTARDGSLSLDKTVLEKAMARDRSAVNALFSQATSGLGDQAADLVDRYTDSLDGILTQRQKGLNSTMDTLDDDAVRLQLRIDSFRDRLVRQFSAMEKVVSSLSAMGNFLNQNFAANTSKQS
jgi:flagellar hook-associated protein 2